MLYRLKERNSIPSMPSKPKTKVTMIVAFCCSVIFTETTSGISAVNHSTAHQTTRGFSARTAVVFDPRLVYGIRSIIVTSRTTAAIPSRSGVSPALFRCRYTGGQRRARMRIEHLKWRVFLCFACSLLMLEAAVTPTLAGPTATSRSFIRTSGCSQP